MTAVEPENWLTYAGDHRSAVGGLAGPTLFGESCTAVAAEFDEGTGRTRLGFVTGDVRSELPLVPVVATPAEQRQPHVAGWLQGHLINQARRAYAARVVAAARGRAGR